MFNNLNHDWRPLCAVARRGNRTISGAAFIVWLIVFTIFALTPSPSAADLATMALRCAAHRVFARGITAKPAAGMDP